MDLVFVAGFHDRLEIGQALLELPADHLVHVHEHAHGLGDKIVFAGHGPGDSSVAAFRLEGELSITRACHGLVEVQAEADGLAGLALGDGHLAFADLIIAHPGVAGADAGGGAVIGEPHVRIELAPRVPRLPVLRGIDVLEDGRGRRGDGGGAADAELGRARGHHD